nr:transposase [Holospora curviuscula]
MNEGKLEGNKNERSNDLTDHKCTLIKDHFAWGKYGNISKHQKKERVNGVVYIITTGFPWRMLPKDFPPYSPVQSFYRRCRIKEIWKKVLSALVKIKWIKAGESEDPSYHKIDSHSVKTTGACEQHGIDGEKKGRKRHRVVDTQGN